MAEEATRNILNAISNLSQGLAWLDALLCPLADLTMCLSRLAVIREEVAVQIIQMSLLFICSAIIVFIAIFNLFALGITVIWKQLGYQNRWWVTLDSSSLFLILRLSLSGLFLLLRRLFAVISGSNIICKIVFIRIVIRIIRL
jgi:hypothetical protein